MYCFPAVLDSAAGRVAVDTALACLATELELEEGTKLRQGNGNSIVVGGVEPADLWRAMDRAVPDWDDRDLFFAPVFL
jgi:uncharacterized protein (DUF2126 family)